MIEMSYLRIAVYIPHKQNMEISPTTANNTITIQISDRVHSTTAKLILWHRV